MKSLHCLAIGAILCASVPIAHAASSRREYVRQCQTLLSTMNDRIDPDLKAVLDIQSGARANTKLTLYILVSEVFSRKFQSPPAVQLKNAYATAYRKTYLEVRATKKAFLEFFQTIPLQKELQWVGSKPVAPLQILSRPSPPFAVELSRDLQVTLELKETTDSKLLEGVLFHVHSENKFQIMRQFLEKFIPNGLVMEKNLQQQFTVIANLPVGVLKAILNETKDELDSIRYYDPSLEFTDL